MFRIPHFATGKEEFYFCLQINVDFVDDRFQLNYLKKCFLNEEVNFGLNI